MPKASNFSFVTDDILRQNLDIAFDHLTELVYLSELPEYNDILKSSFRKTTIIYTASIIEAMLLWFLKNKVAEAELKRESKIFKVTKEIYKINDVNRIVLGEYMIKIDSIKFSKLNLVDINTFCRDYRIINELLYNNIDKVRELRNKLHIGTLTIVETDYSKRDLEFVFSVAKEVKSLAK